MKLIESKTLGTAQASIEFTSIPSTYTDLVLLVSGRSSRSGTYVDNIQIYFNGANSNLSSRYLDGDGVNRGSGTLAFGFLGAIPAATATANTFGNLSVYIPNYSGATVKSYSADVVQENNATNSYLEITAGLWNQTAAINTITIFASNGQLNAGSIASLYGITKGSDGIVTTS
jgi:hypothetical protein